MENKINVAEILKKCPKGTKMYSPIFGDVYLDKIRPHLAIVVTTDKEQGDFKEEFLYDGRYGMNGECMLFPSKYQRNWGKFQRPFKDGDFISFKNKFGNKFIGIFKSIENNYLHTYTYFSSTSMSLSIASFNIDDYIQELRLANGEEKEKLFKELKHQDYSWNAETKTLEKLIKPKFKVGDIIQNKYDYKVEITEVSIDDECYGYLSKLFNGIGSISFEDQNEWELVPNKFDISTLVPYESRVLVRDHKSQTWRPAIWGFFDENCGNHLYGVVGGNCFAMCIPFEGNEHLRGKIGDCDKFYQTWKE